MSIVKQCTGPCGELKTLDQFSPATSGKFGRTARCKACRAAARVAERAADPEKVRAIDRRADAKRGPSTPRTVKWRKEHPEEVRVKQREADRRFRLAHVEQRRQASLQWDLDNPWSKIGRDSRRRARKAGATLEPVDMRAVLTSREDCYLCCQPLSGDIHADHVIPLARGGAHSTSNLLPTHADCNLRKSDLLLSDLDWYTGSVDMGTRVCDAGATTTDEGFTA